MNVRRTKSKGLLSDFFGKLMRVDLLHAQASVDWAVSNFPIFEERLNSFFKSNLNIIIEDSYSDAFYDPVVVIEKAPLPSHVQRGSWRLHQRNS